MIGGGSVIIGPLGEILAGPLREGEDVLTAEVDLDDCVRGKFDLDVVGHYARPDSKFRTNICLPIVLRNDIKFSSFRYRNNAQIVV
jgi:hypothetical protein